MCSVLLRCYFAFVLPILEYCSPVRGSVAECHLQLLERHVYSVARLYPDQSLLSWCHKRNVAELSIRTEITVCSASFHLVLLKLDIPELLPQLIKKRVKSSMTRRLTVENLLPQNVGSIINYLQ